MMAHGPVGGTLPRVLVTGAHGFIGTAVVHRLTAAGHRVVALSHRRTCAAPSPHETVRGDVLDRAAMRRALRGVDAVVHLAGYSRVRESFERPGDYWALHFAGTRTVLDAALEESRRAGRPLRWVQASTAAVYGNPERQPIAETTSTDPTSPYGESKLAADMAVAEAAEAGLGAVVLRLFNVSGAVAGVGDVDRTHIVPKALAVAAGAEPELHVHGDGSAVRDFVHVGDLARACEIVLDACTPGRCEVFNVGGVPASVREIIRSVERTSGRRVRVAHCPPKAEVSLSIADSGRLRGLGWRPEHPTLDEIICDAWNAFPGHR
jgi:UDP-glucose 4-epimerase